jgi:hypothetical protein
MLVVRSQQIDGDNIDRLDRDENEDITEGDGG